MVCLVHPPGLLQSDKSKHDDSQTRFLTGASNNKIKVTNTFEKEAAEPDFFQTTKKSLHEFLDTVVIYLGIIHKAADPFLHHYYLHIILSLLILAFLIAIVKKNLEFNKKQLSKSSKTGKNKASTMATPNPYYFNDSISNSSEENTPISLTGRKTKKPKLDIDYGTVFKSNNKLKPNANNIKSQLNLSNPFFEYANMVSDDEQFKNHYYSNDYIANLQIKQNENSTKQKEIENIKCNTLEKEKETQAELVRSIPNSEAIYVPFDFDQDTKTTELNFNQAATNPTNREFDIFEVFEDKRNKALDQVNLVQPVEDTKNNNANISFESFKFSNTTSNIVYSNPANSIVSSLVIPKERNSHDDFMDFFSNDNTQPQVEKEAIKIIEKTNSGALSQEDTDLISRRKSEKKLKKEYQPSLEKITEEEYRKESDISMNSSCLLHSMDDSDNKIGEDDEKDPVLKRLKKLKLKKCMIKFN